MPSASNNVVIYESANLVELRLVAGILAEAGIPHALTGVGDSVLSGYLGANLVQRILVPQAFADRGHEALEAAWPEEPPA